jgi:predicted transcriptional regulator
MNVSEITTDRFESVDIKATLQEVLPLFRKAHKPAVLVFNGKEYAGMLTEKSIVSSIRNLKTGINGMVRKTPKITPNTTIYETARLMVENQLRQLPVFDKTRVIGVVTSESLIQKAAEAEFGSKVVSTIMSGDVVTLDADEHVGKLINVLREEGISRVPVMSMGKMVGIVTMHDLLQMIVPNKAEHGTGNAGTNQSPLRDIKLKEIMTDSVVTVTPDATVRSAVELMIKRDIQGLVVYEDKKVKGIMTTTDVLLALAAQLKSEVDTNSKFTMQLSHANLVDYDGQYVTTSVQNFVRKFEKFLVGGYINIYFKQHKETFRGTPLILCRVRLKTDHNFYSGRGEGWGADGAFHLAMSSLERQVLNDKEIREDQRYEASNIVEKLDIL